MKNRMVLVQQGGRLQPMTLQRNMTGSDFTALNQAIADLTTQTAATETVEASAAQVMTGFAAEITKAVTDALAADDAADAGSITAAASAIAAVKDRFVASAAPLAAAISATPPAGSAGAASSGPAGS